MATEHGYLPPLVVAVHDRAGWVSNIADVARALLVALALVLAGCTGDRPTPIPEDHVWIQLSTDHVQFEKTAYVSETLRPAAATVQLAFAGAAPPPDAPFVEVQFGELYDWLLADVQADSSGWVVSLRVSDAIPIESGTYTATVQVALQGAANSPIPIEVTLLVHPHPELWQPGQPSVAARTDSVTVALTDGGALAVGGRSAETSIERFDPVTGLWSAAGTLVRGRLLHSATLLESGEVFIAGGLTEEEGAEHPLSNWEIYDPATGSVIATGFLVSPRYSHNAFRLHDGRVLLVGGLDYPSRAGQGVRVLELFDPSTRTSVAAGTLHEDSRLPLAAALLADGRVLVTNDGTPGTELFDPSTGLTTLQAQMSRSRYGHTLVALADGRALVLGGFGSGGMIFETEIYDPDSGLWSPAGSLNVPRAHMGSAAVLLPSGKVLIAAGQSAPPVTSAFEIFDPSAGEWSVVGTLCSPRCGHTVTVLSDGRVVAVGGVPQQERPEFWREPAP